MHPIAKKKNISTSKFNSITLTINSNNSILVINNKKAPKHRHIPPNHTSNIPTILVCFEKVGFLNSKP